MKNLNSYITEKFKISNDIKVLDIKSHITDDPIKFERYNFIVNCQNWKKNRFAILLDCVKEFIPTLNNETDIRFAKAWEAECKELYKNYRESPFGGMNNSQKYIDLLNGPKFKFGTAKFVYDMLNFYLTKSDISIPRKQKVEKMLKECFSKVEENKDKINWY